MGLHRHESTYTVPVIETLRGEKRAMLPRCPECETSSKVDRRHSRYVCAKCGTSGWMGIGQIIGRSAEWLQEQFGPRLNFSKLSWIEVDYLAGLAEGYPYYEPSSRSHGNLYWGVDGRWYWPRYSDGPQAHKYALRLLEALPFEHLRPETGGGYMISILARPGVGTQRIRQIRKSDFDLRQIATYAASKCLLYGIEIDSANPNGGDQ